MIPDDGKSLFDFMPSPPPGGSSAAFSRPTDEDRDPVLQERVLEALGSVYDPEIPVNLVELGLIYALDVGKDGRVAIDMTLTSPSCPVAGALPREVEIAVRAVAGVTDVHVELVWTPPWHPGLMTEAAKLELNMF